VVLSTRVRLARNLRDLPFDLSRDDARASELVRQVGDCLLPTGYRQISFSGLSDVEAVSYVEKHLVSREFARKKGVRSLFCNDKGTVAVMVGEEDHLRIQAILPGFAPEEAWQAARSCDELLDASLPYAFDERLGYLTHCPTNLGTAMRVSAMLFLPAICMAGQMEALAAQLSKLGMTVRGLYGEGSASQGFLYQISNTAPLGLREEDILKKTGEVLQQLVERERTLRKSLSGTTLERLSDRCCRAVGQLRYARLLSSAELLSLWADARLGVALGVVEDVDYVTLSRLLVGCMPATLTVAAQSAGTPLEDELARDRARAAFVQRTLSA
jgi:protein arginine kinase